MTPPSFWELMRDCIPGDSTAQVTPTHYLDAALSGAAEPMTVLEIGSGSGGLDAARSRGVAIGRDVSWSSVPLAEAASLPHGMDTVSLVATFGAFERSPEPLQLAHELARVLAPGGRLVGSVAQLEPYNALSLWNFSLVGFRSILEGAGLRMSEVRPGIDAVALIHYWVHGQSEEHAQWFDRQSPLNAEFQAWGQSTGRRPELVNNRALQYCGRFAFSAEKTASGKPAATAWRRELGTALATLRSRPPDLSGPPGPRPELEAASPALTPPRRRDGGTLSFALRLPDRSDGAAPGRGLLTRILPALRRPPRSRRLTITAERDRYVARELQRGGLAGYEAETLACFLAALEVAPDGWVYDVGANIGVFALLAAALGSRPVVAFEPTPDLAATARAIATENELPFLVEELALGSEPGEATFYLSDKSDASNSLAAGFRPSTRSLTVAVDTLDRYVTRTGKAPGLVKVDTETTEADVLAGGRAVIARYRPWLLVEILHARREADLTSVVRPFGYSWYHITDAIPAPRRDELAGDPEYRYRNWLLTPEPPDGTFWERVRSWRAALAECRPEGSTSASGRDGV